MTGKAVGIGGVFFRAHDPEGLGRWYETHLGVTSVQSPGHIWPQEAGPTVFNPFPLDDTYFPADRTFMLNFRVDDLDALLTKLSAAGIPAETRAEWDMPEVGRFARIHDPEGNPIELWEPAAR